MLTPDASVFPAVAREVARYFRVSPATIHPATSALDVSGWDSLTHTLLVLHLEKTFSVLIDTRAGFQAANVGELAGLIEKELNGQAQ